VLVMLVFVLVLRLASMTCVLMLSAGARIMVS
jgi:hypothetical protein